MTKGRMRQDTVPINLPGFTETPVHSLRPDAEPLPAWLRDFTPGGGFDRQEFLSSRTVYYPGSGSDGQPLRLFAQPAAAHCFIYVDCGLERQTIEQELADHPFAGYECLARIAVSERELVPNGWVRHAQVAVGAPCIEPFCFLEVLQRDRDHGEDHGPDRIAVLFLGADGFATFDALYGQGQPGVLRPFAVVVQDHGFGGARARFGAGGPLERFAHNAGMQPEFLLVAANSVAWADYVAVPGVQSTAGGMHAHQRRLFSRAADTTLRA